MDRENIVRLVISDSGIGIKKSFEKKSGIDYDTDAGLFEMALTTPISSKRKFFNKQKFPCSLCEYKQTCWER